MLQLPWLTRSGVALTRPWFLICCHNGADGRAKCVDLDLVAPAGPVQAVVAQGHFSSHE